MFGYESIGKIACIAILNYSKLKACISVSLKPRLIFSTSLKLFDRKCFCTIFLNFKMAGEWNLCAMKSMLNLL